MKEGWELKKLDDLCTIKGRIGYRGYTKQDLVEKGEGAITLSPSNIINNQFNLDKCTYISWFKYEESPEIMIFNGDILFVKTGSTYGKVALVENLDEKATINPQFVVLKDLKCDNRFLYYSLTTLNFKKKVESIVGGAATPTLSQTNLGRLQIPIPSLPEQKQIVAILDKALAAIDQAQANIEKNIENAKELFDSKKAEYFERLTLKNELSPITETCEKIFAGGDKPKPNFSKTETDEFNIPVISNGEKNDGLFGYTDISKVLKPAITVSARGTIGYTSYRDYPFVPIVRLIVLIPKTEIIDIEFLMYAIKNLDILRTGSSIPQLTVPMIKGYSIPVPSKEEQKEIVECLNQLETELEDYKAILEKKLDELQDLKKSILQKAFAGELTENAVAI